MLRYPLSLPVELKKEAERLAAEQGVSLNQFVLWAVAEKVGGLKERLDDPAFPQVAYRRGASGQPTAVVRGSGVRVQSIALAVQLWGWSPERIAAEYGLGEAQVRGALAFYQAHRPEIEAAIAAEGATEVATRVEA